MRISDWSSDVCSSDLEFGPGIAADDAAEGDDGGGGQAGFEGVRDALPQEGMRNHRLVDRAEGEMIILRLQPREQIARNGRQLAREPTGTVGGKQKAQEIAENGRLGGYSESDHCSYFVLNADVRRIVRA